MSMLTFLVVVVIALLGFSIEATCTQEERYLGMRFFFVLFILWYLIEYAYDFKL